MLNSAQNAWLISIGDPTMIGWVTVFVYFAAAIRCGFKATASKKFGGNYQFWLYLGAFLLFLGINKQLDLQTLFEQTMKELAQTHGLYEYKSILQKIFIALLGLAMLTVLISFRLYLVNTWRNYQLTWIGMILLCVFILMRAAAFNRLDFLAQQNIFGFKINEVLEILAISLIILGTFLHTKKTGLEQTDTVTIRDYVEIIDEHTIVQCPQCGIQPLAKIVDGRMFKCRSCGFKYMVVIAN